MSSSLLKKSIPPLPLLTLKAHPSPPFPMNTTGFQAQKPHCTLTCSPSYNPGKGPPEPPSRPSDDEDIIHSVPMEVPEVSKTPELDPATPDEVVHTRPEEIGPPPPPPDPRPNPRPDFPGPPIPSPPGPDTVPPPPDGLPPTPPDDLPPSPPEIVPPPSTPPPDIEPPIEPTIVVVSEVHV